MNNDRRESEISEDNIILEMRRHAVFFVELFAVNDLRQH